MWKSARTFLAVLVGVVWLVGGSGCVGLDKYTQLEMDHRTLQAEKKQIEKDLYDCRDGEDNIQTRLTSLEKELETKDQLVDNYRQENDRLAAKCDELTRIADKIAGGKGMQTPLIIERVLPPALDSALKDFAAQYPDMVTYDSKRGVVKWASDPLFALGSTVVRDTAAESLRKFAGIINSSAAAGFDVLIVGHTDNVPIKRSDTVKLHPTNWHLSVHRSIAVSDVLQANNVPPTRVGVMGFGEFRPLDDNSTETGRARNRRVEVYMARKEEMLAAGASPG